VSGHDASHKDIGGGDGGGDDSRVLLCRRTLELFAALLVTLFGATIAWGSLEFDTGWSERGPGSGYFPFWIGLVVAGAGIAIGVETVLRRDYAKQPALTASQARRMLAFLVPMVGFLLLAMALGLYVAMAIYLAAVMIVQGGYRITTSLATAFGSTLFLFMMFEKALLVPLKKGPLEALLGIH